MKAFGPFRLDSANQCLWREQVRVALAPKAFDVLRYLVEHAGRLVTQQEMLEALWPDTYVQPEVLRKYILELRRALGDRPRSPSFIETIPKRGFRFVAPVTVARAASSLESEAGVSSKVVGRERRPLSWVVGAQGVYRPAPGSQRDLKRAERQRATELRSPDEV